MNLLGRNMPKIRFKPSCIALATLLAACGDNSGSSNTAAAGCAAFSPLLTVLGSNGAQTSFPAGSTVTLQMQITNDSAQSQTVTQNTGCSGTVLFSISNASGQAVWTSVLPCNAIGVQSYTYAPGQTQVISAQWQQTDNEGASSGSSAPSGQYAVSASYATEQCPTLTGSASLQIQ